MSKINITELADQGRYSEAKTYLNEQYQKLEEMRDKHQKGSLEKMKGLIKEDEIPRIKESINKFYVPGLDELKRSIEIVGYLELESKKRFS
ncbi:MAG: hypothetical protein AABX88_02830, partial [Nanoarchaeota archaeon]